MFPRHSPHKSYCCLLIVLLTACTGNEAEKNTEKVVKSYVETVKSITPGVMQVPNGVAKGLVGGALEDIKQNQTVIFTAKTLSDAQLTLVKKSPKCMMFLELTLAASQSMHSDRTVQIQESFKKGVEAGCYRPLTAYEKLPFEFKDYWESRRARLLPSTNCKNYLTWGEEIVASEEDVKTKRLQLANLFADAMVKTCME